MRAYQLVALGRWHLAHRGLTASEWVLTRCTQIARTWQDADAVPVYKRCKHPGCAKAWAEFDQGRT